MIAYRFGRTRIWRNAPSHKTAGDDRGGYDFRAFCLEVMDVIWGWAVVGGVLLLLSFIL